jgi:mannosyltransferase OCH1-like enzyme
MRPQGDPGPKLLAYLVGPLGIQLPRRLTEKVSQESVTSESNNSRQDNHGGADYRGDGNKGRGK